MSVLSKPHFLDEAAAFAYVEAIIWPEGPFCPHCGNAEKIYELKGVRSKPSKKHPEGVERHGLKKCGECRKQFTVRKGTIFEESHLPLHIWLQAMHLMCSSKKGISSHQLARTLDITVKSAWFLSHRIREALRSDDLTPFGSNGGTVEADETFVGRDQDKPTKETKGKRGVSHKNKVLSLVDRDSGRVRSFVVKDLRVNTIEPILLENIAWEATLMTDEAWHYKAVAREFRLHKSVNHSKEEWVDARHPAYHTNTIEGYFSVFKRGMRGVYQHCSSQHLHRYMAEFDFRYSNRVAKGVNDTERTEAAVASIVGKRLTYRISCGAENA